MTSAGIPPVIELKRVFDQVNRDCAKTGESVVSYKDTEYYADQIQNIWNLSDEVAERLALSLSTFPDTPGLKRLQALSTRNAEKVGSYGQTDWNGGSYESVARKIVDNLLDETSEKFIVWIKDEGKWEEQGDGPLTSVQAQRIAREIRHDCGVPVKILPVGDHSLVGERSRQDEPFEGDPNAGPYAIPRDIPDAEGVQTMKDFT